MDDDFAGLSPERSARVRAWLSTPVCFCRVCGRAVLPTDPRALDLDRASVEPPAVALLHWDCAAEQRARQAALETRLVPLRMSGVRRRRGGH